MSSVIKNIDNLLEGDELAEDVVDSNGCLIAPKGKVLDCRLIQVIQNRNIKKIPINSNDALTEEEIELQIKEIVDQIDLKFSNVKDHPLMKDMHEIIVNHKLKK